MNTLNFVFSEIPGRTHDTDGQGESRFLFFLVMFLVVVNILFRCPICCGADNIKEEEAQAQPNSPEFVGQRMKSLVRPYCGVYCVFLVARLEGIEADLMSLIKPEYIGSRKGSTFLEIKSAAEDLGLHLVPMRNLSVSYLRVAPYRMILHVKRDAFESQKEDHYVVFLGIDGNGATICNPPDPPQVISLYELAQRWNGYGLAVSARPIEDSVLWAPIRKQQIIVAVGAILLLGGLHFVRRRIRRRYILPTGRKRKILKAGASFCFLAATSIVIGVGYSLFSVGGFLTGANATYPIQEAHFNMWLPKVGEKEVSRLVDNGGAVFVDARYSADYEAGAIKGAVNIPVGLSRDGCIERLGQIPEDTRIIVYCQSSSCPFANIVAKKLISCGYRNISVFKGGWMRWISRSTQEEKGM